MGLQVAPLDGSAGNHQVDGPFDDMLQFTNVAGPVIFVEQSQHITGDVGHLAVQHPAVLGQEMPRQQNDVLFAVRRGGMGINTTPRR
jgi:hypothetical protein